jgi:hypothetical protein
MDTPEKYIGLVELKKRIREVFGSCPRYSKLAELIEKGEIRSRKNPFRLNRWGLPARTFLWSEVSEDLNRAYRGAL